MKPFAHVFFGLLVWIGSPLISPASAQDYRAILADHERPENERSMDGDRKPEQILKFYGVKPGDRTADLMAGAGYYTAILSQVVGAAGVVYSANPSFNAQAQERFHSPRFANIRLLVGEMNKVALPEDHSLDFVLIHLDYHMIATPARVEMNKRIFNALKTGGIYGVIDHAANENSGEADRKKLHRIDPQLVVKEINAAGFKLARETRLLRNPKDAHDQPSHKLYGNSDRFVLAFTKP